MGDWQFVTNLQIPESKIMLGNSILLFWGRRHLWHYYNSPSNIDKVHHHTLFLTPLASFWVSSFSGPWLESRQPEKNRSWLPFNAWDRHRQQQTLVMKPSVCLLPQFVYLNPAFRGVHSSNGTPHESPPCHNSKSAAPGQQLQAFDFALDGGNKEEVSKIFHKMLSNPEIWKIRFWDPQFSNIPKSHVE